MSTWHERLEIMGKREEWEKEHLRRIRFIRGLLPENINGRLLDVGAASGSLKGLLPLEVEYAGLDLEDSPEHNVVKWDLNCRKLPFPDNHFDWVICTDVLEHVFYPQEICNEISRVMKNQARSILSFPNDTGLMGRYYRLTEFPRSFSEQLVGHHWLFSVGIARELVEGIFIIQGEKPYLGRIASRLIPEWVLSKRPGLCSCWFLTVSKPADS